MNCWLYALKPDGSCCFYFGFSFSFFFKRSFKNRYQLWLSSYIYTRVFESFSKLQFLVCDSYILFVYKDYKRKMRRLSQLKPILICQWLNWLNCLNCLCNCFLRGFRRFLTLLKQRWLWWWWWGVILWACIKLKSIIWLYFVVLLSLPPNLNFLWHSIVLTRQNWKICLVSFHINHKMINFT